MSHEWAPPTRAQRGDVPAPDWVVQVDTYRLPWDEAADELAPVDRQADPARWLPGRALLITAAVIGVLLLATIVVCLIIWLTPPMHYLDVPSVPKS
ncbi:hypothetical protein [Microlunatus sp. Gsoil 973]|uniref:hypothetical protein n=1 Tax=Microlunatus sp. Gsoil 973 TaxID=2672569 RepID=UPI0012B4632F|nr:hypothetical protein [Microlunatus sp. Gsoil 973]QGN33323.1 hypothetical protein GJV80_11455 [Microlunatus sp. Gsoil 973]